MEPQQENRIPDHAGSCRGQQAGRVRAVRDRLVVAPDPDALRHELRERRQQHRHEDRSDAEPDEPAGAIDIFCPPCARIGGVNCETDKPESARATIAKGTSRR